MGSTLREVWRRKRNYPLTRASEHLARCPPGGIGPSRPQCAVECPQTRPSKAVLATTLSDRCRRPASAGRGASAAGAAPRAGKARPARTLSLPRRLRMRVDDMCPGALMPVVYRFTRITRWEVAATRRGPPRGCRAGVPNAGRAFRLRTAAARSASRLPPNLLALHKRPRPDLTR
jgi:hypothetical protein